MKVIIVSQYFYPDITAAAFRAYDLYNFLRNQGVEVNVLTAYPHKSNVEDVPCDCVKKVKIMTLKGKGILPYMVHYFSFMIKTILLSFTLSKKYDYVFTISPPLFTGVAGYIIAQVKRAYFILDIGDLWPDSAVAAGKFKKGSLFYKTGKWIELFLYQHSDVITCVSKPMQRCIHDSIRNKKAIEKVYVIYSGPTQAEVDRVAVFSESEPVKEIVHKNTRSIYYAGNIGSVQNLEVLLFAAEKLSEAGLYRIAVKFIGDGVERHRLEQYVEERKIKNVTFLGVKSREETFRILHANADILYLSLAPDAVLEKTIPSKLFDYFLLNRPILYGIGGEGRDILEITRAGVYFKPGNVDSLAAAIETLLKNYDRYQACARTLRDVVSNRFTREITFQVLLDGILKSHHR